MVLRSTVIGLLGVYLFVVGALGWLLDRLGFSEEMFWGTLLVFVAAGTAGAVVLSEDVRWRLKRFIGIHLYRNKYDYRAQWMTFTRRLGSTVALEDLGPQLLALGLGQLDTLRDAESGGHPDRRGSPDRQPADRRGHVGRRPAHELALFLGEASLIEQHHGAVRPPHGRDHVSLRKTPSYAI